MSCNQCGAALQSADRFCRACGAPRPVAVAQPSLRCADCRAELGPDNRFCRACGTPGPAGAAEQPAPAPPDRAVDRHFKEMEAVLMSRFRGAEAAAAEYRVELAAGRISREQFGDVLLGLMQQDHLGRYWLLGSEDGRWYMYDGQSWVRAEWPASHVPGDIVETPVDPVMLYQHQHRMDPAPCRGCGAQMLIWESFCGMCGAPAPGFVDRREALEYSRSLLEGALASGRIPRDLFEWRARRLRVELETVDDPG